MLLALLCFFMGFATAVGVFFDYRRNKAIYWGKINMQTAGIILSVTLITVGAVWFFFLFF